MILSTSSGDFPIPPHAASRLPQVPALPDPAEPNYNRRAREFTEWLESSPEHTVGFERLRRWHLVQDELARQAKTAGQPFIVTDDGLD
jgi:hypothetical protein